MSPFWKLSIYAAVLVTSNWIYAFSSGGVGARLYPAAEDGAEVLDMLRKSYEKQSKSTISGRDLATAMTKIDPAPACRKGCSPAGQLIN